MMESRVTLKCHARFGERDRETRKLEGLKVRSVPTPLSPLLANIALHGLETRICEAFPYDVSGRIRGSYARYGYLVTKPTVVRYADDLVILCENKTVIHRCREILSEWLSDVGLELRLDKTRLTHTLDPLLSEDGIAGFDFLGHHIQQYPAGKYRSARDHLGRSLGFKTLIVPSKQACKAHQAAIGKIIHRHIGSPQLALIKALNPVIRGWAVYYRASDAQSVGEFSQQDHLTYLKLRRWAKRRCHSTKAGHQKYWTTIGNNHWVFSSEADQPDSFRLLCHKEFSSSSNAFIKVKGDRSFYDGDWVYWSTRLGRHPELHSIKASLLKKQKGKCPWCDLYFCTGDVVEIDHIQPKSSGGKDSWQNRQLLHRHCHDAKTALDGSLKSQSDNDDVL